MIKNSVHINCDLGEGGSFDAELMPFISACNIACGGHAGDADSVEETIDLAIKNNVQIGAHPSYPDKENFGRESLNIDKIELKEALKKQVLLVKSIVEEKGEELHHVKPHGALYNDIVKDANKAEIVIETVREIDSSLILFVPPNSAVQKLAKGKVRTWIEGFADRAYNADLSLVSRKIRGAVLTTKEEIYKRVFALIAKQQIITIDNQVLQADFDTICLHSDTQNAVEALYYLKDELAQKGINIKR